MFGHTQLSLSVNEYVNVCAWCPAMDQSLFQSVFLSHIPYTWDLLQIHCHADQDESLTEDK